MTQVIRGEPDGQVGQMAREDKMAWVGQVVNEDQVVMVGQVVWSRGTRCTYLGDQVVRNRVTVVAGVFFVHFSQFTFSPGLHQ